MRAQMDVSARAFVAGGRDSSLLSKAQFGLLMRAGDYAVAAKAYFDFSREDEMPEKTHYAMLALGASHQRFVATLAFLAFPELRESGAMVRGIQRIHAVASSKVNQDVVN